MEAGRLDRRVTLQSPSTSRDSFGEALTSWQDAGIVWARRFDMRASERFTHQQTEPSVETIFTIRYRDDVRVTWRVLDDEGRIYDIEGIREPDRRRSLELLCRHEATEQRA